jgi:hypothetical protein
MQTPHDPLDSLLERWRGAAPPLAGPVGPEVWRRVADAEASAARAGWRERIELAFARPSFAAAFVTACVLMGLFLAEARISRLQAERNAQLARHYLELVDPLLADGTPRGAPAAVHP